MIGRPDKYHCPKCKIKMENKGSTNDDTDWNIFLWQCPKCKNVELLLEDNT